MEQQRLQQLIDKVLNGQASAKEQQELDAWYAAQETGKGLTTELDDTQKAAMGAAMLDTIHQRIQTKPRYRTWMMAAAVLVVLAVGAMYFFVNRPIALASVWKEEKSGSEVQHVHLPDGSSVWLNAGSSLRYDSNFVSGKREVWMEGEAFFDVTHVEGKSFEVHAGTITTRVLGTAFNIDAYTDEITVFVKRGKVSVADAAILLPNQRLIYKKDGTFERYDSVMVDYASWTSGQLTFRDMPFGEVAKRLEKRFGIRLVFKDKGIDNCPITATFNQNTPVKDMLEMLAITNGSTIEAGDKNTYLISGKKQCK